ncbi:putative glucose transporter [Encephalitozoon hellem ATCC 50504]|uniref:Glucose transporter member 3 n=1 Tax=Encephalitozoon hellem TaxID=27973 RepID=A0A9Q9F827_ENCHE|nr:putative glucose transporter [Encephalitozoon hellem ATCC 50504]AFM98067.1 putative glucose transporter [Encephalitozoon hellem ATCC 50504]UTX42908.1 glucose transporter member 3 [Encephalitozoon hellem]WEL38365.1 hexose transporter [Encephalitozoon hellem]|eukprot:XP_003887048.1 putative glucose transporter [Encephalitozoon hellem ATCC 50504]
MNTIEIQKSVYYSTVMASMSSVLFGTSLTVMGSMYPYVSKMWRQTMDQAEVDNLWGLASSSIFLGCLASNILSSIIKPNMKRALIFNSIFYAMGYMTFFFSQSFMSIFSGRLIIGFASGITCAIVPIYTSFISPVMHRGFLLSFHPLGITIGITLGNALSCLNSESTWTIPLIITLFLIGLNFVGLFWAIDPFHQEKPSEVSLYALIRNRKARRSVFLVMLVHVSQHLCGVDYITLFLKDLFPADVYSPEVTAILISLASVVITALSGRYVDRVGRKPLIIISSLIAGGATAMLTFGLYPTAAALLFVAGYNMGLCSIPWFITAEIFPPKYSGPAGLLGVSLNWLSAYTTLSALYPLHIRYGRIVFSFYTACMALFAGLMAVFFKETKNRAPAFQ